MANTAGIFTIPSIAFGKDLSPQIRMTVKPEKQSATTDKANLLMELETSTQNTWVQGQIIVTARLLSATNISQFAISKLKTNNMDLVIEKLGDDKRYQTQRGNTAYLVFERKFAIFPQQAGSLQIEPFLGEVEVVSGASSYFDPFRRKTSIKRARSKAIDITVAGIPKQFTGKTWLPATELKLVEEWSAKPGTFKAGEPVTRTLSLLANGLTSAQLPELSIASVKNLKQYPDKPLLKDNKQDDGIIGIRQEKIAVIPTEKGSYTLPAIEIPWWNTNTGQMEVARIAAQTIQVSAGTVNQTPTPQVIDNINPAQPAVTTTAVPASQGSFWFWLSLVLATGWSLTVLIWWWTTRHKSFSKPNINITKTRNLQQARQSLKKACKQNDATACRTALLAWGKLFLKTDHPVLRK